MKAVFVSRLTIIGLSVFILMVSGCQKTPDYDKTVRDAVSKLASTDSYSFEISLDGKGEDKTGALVGFSMNALGSGNTKDSEHPEGDVELTLGLDGNGESGKLSIGLRFLPDYFYIQLKDLSLPESVGLPSNSIDSFLNSWWEVPLPEENDSYLKEVPQKREKLIGSLQVNSLFQNIEQVGEEEIKGVKVLKYRMDLDRKALISLLDDMTVNVGKDGLSENERNAYIEGLKQIDFSGNAWIGKSDGKLYSLAGSIRSNSKDVNGGTFSADLKATFWDFGKKFNYEKPEGATPFNPALLLGLFSGATGLSGNVSPSKEPLSVEAEPIDSPLGSEQVNPSN